MNYKTILGALFVMALIVTACAPAQTEVPTLTDVPTDVSTTEPTDAATEPPVATDTASVATDTATVDETATVSVPVTGEAAVNVTEAEGFGPILVNGEGMSLYVFMADTQDSGTSTCGDDDGCATEWPPLTTEGDPVAGEGVDATLLGTITRDDGSLQVTYNGWPLYLFEEDAAAGDTNGQGLEEFGGLWFLVSPAGEAIQQ
jgi:predicted lipoprotein with Yx(FWY)xxD motif